MGKYIVRNDAPTITLWEIHRRCSTRRLFIKHGPQFGFCNDLFKNGEFGAIEMLLLLHCAKMIQVQRPDANFRNLERVENIHGYGIRSLIRQVASNSAAKTFKGLTNINGFAIVIIKGIDAPLATTNSMTVIVVAVEEKFYLPADRRNIGWKANGLPLTCV